MKEVGGPQVLELADIAKPEHCGDHQVLVRVLAAGVNPIDTKLRGRGLYFPGNLPAVLGCDGAGLIEKVGADVEHLQVGDQVYYCYGGLGQKDCGNYAEYALVDAAYVAHKPAALGFDEAAAAPLVLITAWESLFDRAGLRSGQKVLVQAGAGGVGHVAIQLAKIAGAEVATTVSSDEKAAFARELGADLVINYRTESVEDKIMGWTDGQGVDVAFDTVGGDTFNQCASLMAHYGSLVTILQVPDDVDWKGLRLKNVRVSQELMLSPMVYDLPGGGEHQAAILEQCGQFFDEKQLAVYVADVLPLEQAAEAHRRIEAGSMAGKLVLDIAGDMADE